MLKRMYDIIFAIVFLIVASPILVFAALGIVITSKGPIIYKANRVGKNGIPFVVYKFRTMIVDSGEVKVTTLKNDERVYPFGSFLRKSKIDEMPQIINILLNQMSVVGPRPEDIIIAESIYVGKYKNIYNVKPGLTSPASLFDYTHGEYYHTQEEYIKEFLPIKLDIELHYVKYNSFLYDIKITLRTAKIIMQTLFAKKRFGFPEEYYIVQEEIKSKGEVTNV